MADQVTMRWSLDFSWTPFYVHVCLTQRKLYSDLHEIRLAVDFSVRNSCVIRGVCVLSRLEEVWTWRQEGNPLRLPWFQLII